MKTERIIEVAEKHKEFVTLEDGFVYYWPSKGGALTPYHLRTLADELDRRNEAWQKQIEEFFEKQI